VLLFNWTRDECIVLPITLLVIVILSLTMFVLLRKKSEKIRQMPLIIITIIILILEVVKQVVSYKNGYSLWSIPLHFCSLFLYFYPLAVFAKGKVKEFGKTMSLVCSLLMFALFYINPGTIIGDSCSVMNDFANFHTFVYHHLVILFLFISLLLNFYKFKKQNFIHVLIGFTIYAVVMLPFAYILQTNFCNILESNIPFMESFRLLAGQIVYTTVMFAFAICSGLFIVLMQYLINKLKRRKV